MRLNAAVKTLPQNELLRDGAGLSHAESMVAVVRHFAKEEEGFRAALSASGAPLLAEDSLADAATQRDVTDNLFTRVGCLADVTK